MEKEIWKICKNHPKYECSNLGRIANIKTGYILTPQINKKGYYTIILSDEVNKHTKYNLHRIIAETFIDNPDPIKYNHVTHKDENKRNNNINNLEWCDNKYNHNYGTIKERTSSALSYGVVCKCDANKNILKEYNSVKEVINSGINIRRTMKKNISERFYKNYYWYYKKELYNGL